MKDYRRGLRAALAANGILFVLLVMAVGVWWHSRTAVQPQGAGALVSSSSPSAATPSSSPAPPARSEPPLGPVQLSPRRLQSIGVKTGAVASRLVEDRIRTTGNVTVDETKLAYVQLRFSGYVQKVFVDATYQYVHKGQPLFTIYSPDLASTEREYLLARQNERQLAGSGDVEVDRDAHSLVEATAARLAQWNIPSREIRRLETTGRVQQDLEIDSPVSGYVTEREALPNKFAQPSTRLYTVADLSTVWVFAQVFQNDLGRIKAGDPATLTVDAYPGRVFSGRIDFIYPDIDMATRTARVRLVFRNPELRLVPGMFVNVALDVPLGRHEVIPAAGVLRTGTRQIVFVDRGGGMLEPRDVQLGARVGADYIVLSGLRTGERIVTSANFLIDSESQLQAALGAFASSPASSAGAAPAGSRATVTLTTDPSPARKGSNVVRVRLTATNGHPIDGAQVTATFFLAAMPSMGMASMRVVAPLAERAGGLYEGAAMLGRGGAWHVTVVARRGSEVVASAEIPIDATGGM